jgi:solute carrier family 25 phosphate transporter 3
MRLLFLTLVLSMNIGYSLRSNLRSPLSWDVSTSSTRSSSYFALYDGAVVEQVIHTTTLAQGMADQAINGAKFTWENANPKIFAAGGACASFSHAVAVPFDVVKTRIQTQPGLYGKLQPVETLRKIVDEEGVQSLTSGLTATITGYAVQGSLKFGLYELLKPVTMTLFLSPGASTADFGTKLAAISLASICGESVGSLLLCPFEAVRIRQVTAGASDKDSNAATDGVLDSFARIKDADGLGALWEGLGPILFKQLPYTVVSLCSFELLSQAIYDQMDILGYNLELEAQLRPLVTVAASAIAASLSAVASQPGDSLLSRVNSRKKTMTTGGTSTGSTGPTPSLFEEAREMGLSGLFSGLPVRFAHCISIVVTQLVVYDAIKQSLGIAAAGGH